MVFLAAAPNSQRSPVCGFAANGGSGSVVLLGFAQIVLQVPVGSLCRS